MQPKVSVIIPVYRAEFAIAKCAESLFSQTLDEMEFIFVNDCTPDKSMDILNDVIEKFPARRNQVKIINLERNSKQAAARNAGLRLATGEYVIHCDPDDWVDSTLYEEMYNATNGGNVDIISCDYIIEEETNKSTKYSLPTVARPYDVLNSESYYLMCVWNHLVKREVIVANNLTFFPDINCSEDVGFMSRVFAVSKTIGHVAGSQYHYRKGVEQSMTAIIDKPEIVEQRVKCLNLIDDFMRGKGYDSKRFAMLLRYKRDIKNLYLRKDTLDKWLKIFPEVCEWECRQPGISLPYKIAYKMSHRLGIWPMKLLLMRH